jgi:hypothetical protein
MSIALVARTLIVGAYLLAVGFHGRLDTVAGLVAAAVVAVWAAPLIRDGLLPAVTPARRSSSRYAAED